MDDVSLCGSLRLLRAVFGGADGHDHLLALQEKYGIANHCLHCRKPYLSPASDRYERLGYCSPDCYHESRRIEVACDQCGKLQTRMASALVWWASHPHPNTGKPTQRLFCDHHCRGAWIGIHYGFRAHPENKRFKKGTHSETGEGALRLSRRLGIPTSAISSILQAMRKGA